MRLSIVTINYNSSENTINLLESLKNQTSKNFEIIVVDNNSDDVGKLMDYQTTETNIIYIKNSHNLGYSRGNNVGIHQALENGSEWVILLNNDAWVEGDFVERLRAVLSVKNGVIGIPLIEGGPVKSQGNHGASLVAYCGRIQWLKSTLKHEYRIKNYDSKFQILDSKFYAIGGAMAVRKDVFEKIGLLDENYFLYFEDADFSVRARKNNIITSIQYDIMIYHIVSASTKKLGSPMLLRYHYRNALYFNLKNGPWYIKLLVWPWSWIVALKQIIKILAGKNREQSIAILKGVVDWYTGKMGKLHD